SSASNTPGSPFQDFRVRVKLPFHRNPKFCGREDLLKRLCEILKPRNLEEHLMKTPETGVDVQTNFARRTIILQEMGGIGKSQITSEYAHRFINCYSSIFWTDAGNQLVRHYSTKGRTAPNSEEIANTLGIPAGGIDRSGRINKSVSDFAVMEAVNSWLSENENRQWLLLIDNKDNSKEVELEELIPPLAIGALLSSQRDSRTWTDLGRALRWKELG
ncbi:hypothetical protein RUND412_004183, partial [Rhizina undulata]